MFLLFAIIVYSVDSEHSVFRIKNISKTKFHKKKKRRFMQIIISLLDIIVILKYSCYVNEKYIMYGNSDKNIEYNMQ